MSTDYTLDEDNAPKGGGIGALLSQLPIVLWDRRWAIVIPAVLGLVLATAGAFLLPKKYMSAAVLLVQAPTLPPEIIGVQADEAVAQRIEAIRQQIINRPALIAMIQRNGLYEKERGSDPLSKVVEDMRDSILLVPQTVDLGPTSTQDKTISVKLSFYYKDPVKAQAVTQQLMERIVEVDSTNNAEQLSGTVQFLSDQQQDLQRKIGEAEGQLAAFNSRFGNVLASQSMAAIGGSGAAFDVQIANLQRDISDLEAQKRLLATADQRDPVVVQAEAALAAARATYSDEHPDVVLAKQRLEQAKKFAQQNTARIPADEIDNRIRIARGQIAQLQAAQGHEAAQASSVMAQRAEAPAVEQQAAQIQQRVTTLYKQYEDISNRLLSAKASARAGEEQMGERLIVVDPPVVPDSPVSPNRPLLIAIGAIGGLALGFILALATELLLRPIRDPSVLEEITGSRPLAMVPVVDPSRSPANRTKGRKFKRFWKRSRSRPKSGHKSDELLSA